MPTLPITPSQPAALTRHSSREDIVRSVEGYLITQSAGKATPGYESAYKLGALESIVATLCTLHPQILPTLNRLCDLPQPPKPAARQRTTRRQLSAAA